MNENIIHIYGDQNVGKTTIAKILGEPYTLIQYNSENIPELIGMVFESLLSYSNVIIEEFNSKDNNGYFFIDTLLEITQRCFDEGDEKIILLGQHPLPHVYNEVYSWRLDRDFTIKHF